MVTTTNGQQRCYTSEGTIAGTKMRRARHVENEDTWQRYVEVVTHRQQDTGAPRALAKVQEKKGPCKCKGKKRTPDTVCDVEKGKTQESRLATLKKCNMFKLRERLVTWVRCVETRTHTRLRRRQMNQSRSH